MKTRQCCCRLPDYLTLRWGSAFNFALGVAKAPNHVYRMRESLTAAPLGESCFPVQFVLSYYGGVSESSMAL